MAGRNDRWGGGGPSTGRYNSYGGGSSSSGRYDDDDDGGGGFGSSRSRSDEPSSNRRQQSDSRYDSHSGGGRGSRGGGEISSLPLRDDSRYSGGYSGGGRGANSQDLTRDEYEQRLQSAHRRMEESSGNSLRVLHETVRMGVDTVEELEEQAETLDRAERRLDEMDVDLDQSKRHMRNIKSVFGGIGNYFERRRKIKEVTDPKMPKASTSAAQERRKMSSNDERRREEPGRGAGSYRSTGNDVVDENLDEMEKALHSLRGLGEVIGEQLDDSDLQIDRVRVKLERDDVKIKKLNRDIKGQL